MIVQHRTKMAEQQRSTEPIIPDNGNNLNNNSPASWTDFAALCSTTFAVSGVYISPGDAQHTVLLHFEALLKFYKHYLKIAKPGTDIHLDQYLKDLKASEAAPTDGKKRGFYQKGLVREAICHQLGITSAVWYKILAKATAARDLVLHYGIGIATIFHLMSRLATLVIFSGYDGMYTLIRLDLRQKKKGKKRALSLCSSMSLISISQTYVHTQTALVPRLHMLFYSTKYFQYKFQLLNRGFSMAFLTTSLVSKLHHRRPLKTP